MKRWLPLLMLASCALVVLMWIWSWRDAIYLHHGRVLVLLADPQEVETYLISRVPRNREEAIPTVRLRMASGYIWSDTLKGAADKASWSGLGFEYHRGTAGVRSPFRFEYQLVALPFWAIMLPLMALTAVVLARRRRQHRWAHGNKCRECGYDLRGSPDRCPECGTATSGSTERVNVAN